MAQMMSVQIQTGQLRSSPSFLAGIVGEVAYARQVQVLEERAGWMRVAVPGTTLTGWMHESALSRRRIVVQAGDADVERAATTGEIALAGKGFNEQVEWEFRSRNPELDFRKIDQMQTSRPTMTQIQQFAREGRLRLAE
ncbi:SH3 domain-containing protein [Desulfonatronum thioautotrophicum]|uniref:SH3 domain-containing protein n=1 Tax=Desulfonatronum thioautotrophicum TaxID=617001 RepID=UPI00069964F2|nr:SH3 domain-containing protein [Desulfonatronum thioautotrophicum]